MKHISITTNKDHSLAPKPCEVADRTLSQSDPLLQPLSDQQMKPGQLILGKYALKECIGRGGVGSVWLVEQISPIKRDVAIKFLREESTSSVSHARFAFEHQALAAMNHPHIAKVIDGGVADDYGPFMVMEYVRGSTFLDYCNSNRLSIVDRLKLFVQVCGAVEHAHQRGIIHRDIKPSNIIIDVDSIKHFPKVIDFGLARSLPGFGETGASKITVPGLAIGTPAYMSPEQVTGDENLDVRTDVYSLGILLYELLTGRTPFPVDHRRQANWVDTFRQILEVEPRRPSHSNCVSDRPSGFTFRRSVMTNLTERSIQDDLDWVVLRAIEKRADARYQTVEAFRRDVENLLNHFPVAARPVSRMYHLRKFARRHQGAVAGTVAACFVAVLTVSVLAHSLSRARIAESQAREALARQAEASRRIATASASILESFERSIEMNSYGGELALDQVYTLHELSPPHVDDRHFTLEATRVDKKNGSGVTALREALRLLEHIAEEQPELPIYSLENRLRHRIAVLRQRQIR